MRAVFVSLLILTGLSGSSQQLSTTYVHKWLAKCDSSINLKKVDLYVVDGVPYSPAQSDSVLNLVAVDKLAGIDYFLSGEMKYAETPDHCIAVIKTRKKQIRKWKKSEMKEAVSKYQKPPYYENHITTNSKEPVLVIDGKQICPADCYNELAKIKVGNIEQIDITTHAVPSEYYGQNAKNGLVHIWTYQKK